MPVYPGAPTIRTPDRALLTMGFLGAFRRSELVSLDAADVQFTPEGLLITLRRSKTDQLGEGRNIAIPHGKHEHTDAVRALRMWLSASGITEGPIFRQVRKQRIYKSQLTAQVQSAGHGHLTPVAWAAETYSWTVLCEIEQLRLRLASWTDPFT